MKVFKLQERITVALFLDNIYKSDDIADIWQFDQTWGSTALGFNGCGGDCITTALTSVVLKTDGNVDVYFGTRKAYTKRLSPKLMDDVRKYHLVSVMDSHIYDE